MKETVKKIFKLYALVALMATALVSCEMTNLDDINPDNSTEQVVLSRVEISAQLPDGTRVQLGDDTGDQTPIYWEADDTITITVGEADYTFAIQDFEENSSSARFYCDAAPATLAAGSYKATYSANYTTKQSGHKADVEKYQSMTANFTITEGQGWDDVRLSFNSEVAVVKITLNNDLFKGATINDVQLLTRDNNFEYHEVVGTTGEFVGDEEGNLVVYFVLTPQEVVLPHVTACVAHENEQFSHIVYRSNNPKGYKSLEAGKLYRMNYEMVYNRSVLLSGVTGEVNYELYWENEDVTSFDTSVAENIDLTLLINGSGEMDDYSESNVAPWAAYNHHITNVDIKDGVTNIPSYFLHGNSSESNTLATRLGSLFIHNSVTYIGAKAFDGCQNLSSMTIGDGLVDIHESAFANCSKLNNFYLPEGLKTIGKEAFSNCTTLESITFPSTMESIGTMAFFQCESLKDVYLPNKYIDAVNTGSDAWGAFDSNAEGRKLHINSLYVQSYEENEHWSAYLADFNVFESGSCGEGVVYTMKSNGTDANGNTTYTLSISNNADGSGVISSSPWETKASKITKLIICEGITTISDNAFSSMNNLTELILPDSLTDIGDYAFNGCSSLTYIALNGGLKTIGAHAFSGCSALKIIIIPNTVTTVGDRAFNGCSAAYTAVIGEGVTSLGDYIFDGCNNLKAAYLLAPESPIVGDYMLPQNGQACFMIPDENWSVYDTNSDWTQYSALNQLIQYNNDSFKCGNNAYYILATNEGGLDLIIYGEGHIYDTQYKDGAYWKSRADKIVSLNIMDGIITIGNNNFYDLAVLENIQIPNTVNRIKHAAFFLEKTSYSLKSLVLPSSVKLISDYAFSNHGSLESIYIKAIAPPSASYDMFSGHAANRKIYVPTQSAATYRTTVTWDNYAASILPMDL